MDGTLAFVVSANYFDRSSTDNWRMRTATQTPKESVAYPFLIAKDVTFTCSVGYPEDEYGCRLLALCGEATGYITPQAFDKAALVQLHYQGTYFTGEQDQPVYGADELYLDVDCNAYALNPSYEEKVLDSSDV